MVDIKYGFFYVAYLVAQQIDGYGGQGIVAIHVLGVRVVNPQILSEAQCFSGQPCLLELYENQMFFAFLIANGCPKVNTEYRE